MARRLPGRQKSDISPLARAHRVYILLDMSNATTADRAIARSISHTEIVTIDYDAATAADLDAMCEGSAEAERGTEYWGITDGDEWRVHMRRPTVVAS